MILAEIAAKTVIGFCISFSVGLSLAFVLMVAEKVIGLFLLSWRAWLAIIFILVGPYFVGGAVVT